MVDRKMLVSFLCVFVCVVTVHSASDKSEVNEAFVTWDKASEKFQVLNKEPQEFVARGVFRNDVNNTGWSFLNVSTTESYPDYVQAFAAGVVEGYLTSEFIDMQWTNTVDGYCNYSNLSPYCQRLWAYLKKNLDWMNDMINQNKDDPYWQQVSLFLLQVDGLEDGYGNAKSKTSVGPPTTHFGPFGLYFFQISGDLEDLETALDKPTKSHVLGTGSCSALIKLLPGAKDIYVSHDTWSDFSTMLRILKKYDFPFHTNGKVVKGKSMTFSSYPGTIMSGDDYYLISSGLVSLETTIGNSNNDLLQYIKPEGTVPEGIRTMVSNRMTDSGQTWSEMFKLYNSGTYNNQWMIVDYKQFTAGSSNMQGLLYILEQIPGNIEYADKTQLLMEQGYWPSYNVPYFQKIFNMSGCPENVAKYGDWFSYDKTPRALIFKRDHGKVTDLDSMIKLMRYNDFTHDPLSRCNCTPPYSAENAISARCDLNPAGGKYPIGALGHRSHGGTDMKLTNTAMFQSEQFIAIGGPTYDQLPPFQWSKADFAPFLSHIGHPDVFKFDPLVYDGTVDYKPYYRN